MPIPGWQYKIEGNKITYAVAPQPGDKHEAIYWKDRRVDYSVLTKAEFIAVSSFDASETYSPIPQIGAGLNPFQFFNLGTDFSPEYADLIPFEGQGPPGWVEREDIQEILPLPTMEDLADMWAAADIVGTVGGTGFTRLTVHDVYLRLTFAGGAIWNSRPTFFESLAGEGSVDGDSLPFALDRTNYSGIGGVPTMQMSGFYLPS